MVFSLSSGKGAVAPHAVHSNPRNIFTLLRTLAVIPNRSLGRPWNNSRTTPYEAQLKFINNVLILDFNHKAHEKEKCSERKEFPKAWHVLLREERRLCVSLT